MPEIGSGSLTATAAAASTWEDTPDGPALRLDDGTLHTDVGDQVRREVVERAEDL